MDELNFNFSDSEGNSTLSNPALDFLNELIGGQDGFGPGDFDSHLLPNLEGDQGDALDVTSDSSQQPHQPQGDGSIVESGAPVRTIPISAQSIRLPVDDTTVRCPECWAPFKNIDGLIPHHRSTHSRTDKFRCHLCNAKFNNERYLKNHHNFRQRRIRDECPHCMKRIMSTITAMDEHIESHHGDQAAYQCKRCIAKFLLSEQLRLHTQEIHEEVSQGDDDAEMEELEKSDGEEDAEDTKWLRCHLCGFRALIKARVQQHVKRSHSTSQFKCGHCTATFATFESLRKHKRPGRMGSDWECPHCLEIITGDEIDVFSHIATHHTGTLPHRCSSCHASFKHMVQLAQHMGSKHDTDATASPGGGSGAGLSASRSQGGDQEMSKLDSTLPSWLHSEDDEMQFSEGSGDQFAIEERLSAHTVPNASGSEVGPLTRSDQPGRVARRETVFNGSVNLVGRAREHAELRCLECYNPYNSIYKLREHMKRHRGETPAGCKYCTVKFKDKASLQSHTGSRTRIVNRITLRECTHCLGPVENNKLAMDRHLGWFHLATKPQKCSVCMALFRNKAMLKEHYVSIHGGLRQRREVKASKLIHRMPLLNRLGLPDRGAAPNSPEAPVRRPWPGPRHRHERSASFSGRLFDTENMPARMRRAEMRVTRSCSPNDSGQQRPVIPLPSSCGSASQNPRRPDRDEPMGSSFAPELRDRPASRVTKSHPHSRAGRGESGNLSALELIPESRNEDTDMTDEPIFPELNLDEPLLPGLSQDQTVFPEISLDDPMFSNLNLDQLEFPDLSVLDEPQFPQLSDPTLEVTSGISTVGGPLPQQRHTRSVSLSGLDQLVARPSGNIATSPPLSAGLRLPEGIRCRECFCPLRTSWSLFEHKKTHRGEQSHECALCRAKFNSARALARHLSATWRRNEDNTARECSHCLANVPDGLQELHEHIEVHHVGDRPHKCNRCVAEFRAASQLEEHHRSFHELHDRARRAARSQRGRSSPGSRTTAAVMRGGVRKRVTSRQRCAKCYKTFSCLRALMEHSVKAHKASAEYECSMCAAVFVTHMYLAFHCRADKVDADRISCPHCRKTLKRTDDSLAQHNALYHNSGWYLTRCPLCPAAFSEHWQLAEHAAEQHAEQAGHQGFTLAGAVPLAPRDARVTGSAEHQRWMAEASRSSPLRPHVCIVCRRRFEHAAQLEEHGTFAHSEGSKLKCRLCNAAFAVREEMLAHQQMQLPDVRNSRVGFCPHCGWTITGGHAELASHVRQMHEGLDVYHCRMCPARFRAGSQLRDHEAKEH